jgi:hypothetical protein
VLPVAEKHIEPRSRAPQVVERDAVTEAVAVHVAGDELGLARVVGARLAAPQFSRREGAVGGHHGHHGRRAFAQVTQHDRVVAPAGAADHLGRRDRGAKQQAEQSECEDERQGERATVAGRPPTK